ncbi:two-component system sensor histidine kinase DegS [Mobilisporobacter senegalensis]|uniref:Oxygen sensor histidine kinase NreB n=1 Tax=Mobilisporobacter senegalensis TaxID=1329262 RepID=A0A3N1X5S3_9FIRM|nr:sensor histidine kinase [Mobilisporobacter senegalensis]ROR22139.1 two-component system sensor histidine kinase DegS [Mobilisporobacter senegalensis]
MGKDDITINDNIRENSKKMESYLNEIADYFSNESSVLKLKADETTMNINNLQDDLDITFVNENENYNLFSPMDKSVLNQKEKLKSEVSLYKLQLNECMEEIERLNRNKENISKVKNYIMMLEDVINQNCKSVSNITHVEKSDNKKDIYKGIQILNTQELERKRIARDLHDSTVQNLTSLIHKTELCSKYVDIDNIRTKLELEIMKKTIRTTINDMREIIFNLRPMSLDDLGLIPTVERYIEQIMNNNDIKIIFTYLKDENNIYSIINFTLFRIIQEACNNVLKHANANTIKIHLTYNESNINLSIEDDGMGFDITNQLKEKYMTNSNFGLSIMKERVYLLSGQIHIESNKNQGTKLNIDIPMNSYMEDKE